MLSLIICALLSIFISTVILTAFIRFLEIILIPAIIVFFIVWIYFAITGGN